MAEKVQENMEGLIAQAEAMTEAGLLSPPEVRQLLKRRKHHEYAIQKRQKVRGDFLNYIQYEIGVLELLKIRRLKTGFRGRKKSLEHDIITRIHKLFKILEARFGGDLKIWLSHIDFLREWRRADVSAVFTSMLLLHHGKPEIWIAKAKHEAEQDNMALARSDMLTAFRYHPKSERLYQEYLRLEMGYVEALRQRLSVLGWQESTISGEDQDIVHGALVKVVFNSAARDIPDVSFISSLLLIATEFPGGQSTIDMIQGYLKEHFGADPMAWDSMARAWLATSGIKEEVKDGDAEDNIAQTRLDRCCSVYEEGLSSTIIDLSGKKKLLALFYETVFALAEPVEMDQSDEPTSHYSDEFRHNLHQYCAQRILLAMDKADEGDYLSSTLVNTRIREVAPVALKA
eukprot:maker-scaffold507_size152468-snap-gene-0.34 protein:Tk11916 transcript:maker-scaffold507_size152468-snap-gene-0.34-mRNA-1 annotation:"unnamed protein product"